MYEFLKLLDSYHTTSWLSASLLCLAAGGAWLFWLIKRAEQKRWKEKLAVGLSGILLMLGAAFLYGAILNSEWGGWLAATVEKSGACAPHYIPEKGDES